MRIALAHMTLKLMSRKSNIEKVRKAVHEAKIKGARTVILPPMINTGPLLSFYTPAQSRTIIRNHAERIPQGYTVNQLVSVAVNNGVFIIAGPMLERAGPKVFLTSIAISPTGNIIDKYRKIVLNPGDQQLGISPGREPKIIKIKESYGLLIENDIYYPELSRALTVMGASLLLSYLRVEPVFDRRIEKILEARSIENNIPLIAIGGAAKNHDELLGETPTLIIDPSDGLLEKITLESKIGGATSLGEEHRVVLLELQNYVAKRMNNQKEQIMKMYTEIYKKLKQQLQANRKHDNKKLR